MSGSAAELRPYRVRRNYLGQIWRYGWSTLRWVRRLRDFHQQPEAWRRTRLAGELRELLAHAEDRTLFYPEHFHRSGVQARDLRSPEDLRWFPSVSRADLQGGIERFLTRDFRERDRDEGILWRTSGSTGEPVSFFIDGESSKFALALYRFLGGSPRRPFSSGIVFLCSLPNSSVYSTWLPLFGGTTFRKLHFAEPDAEGVLTRLNPSVLTGDPHSLGMLEAGLRRGAIRVTPRLIVSSAFALPESLAASLAERTGARIADCYSIAETGPLAVRCAPGRPFHLLGSAAQVETDSGGEILVTNLRNRFLPLIRYRTGDLGEIASEGCSCGYAGPSIVRLSGRTGGRFEDRQGVRVDPSRVEPVLSRLPLRQFQLIQESRTSLRLRYVALEPIAGFEELERALASLLGGPVNLSVERMEQPIWSAGEKPIPYLYSR
jgi:phenylacetate-CoA ligase